MAEAIWTKKAVGQLDRAIETMREAQDSGYAKIVLSKDSNRLPYESNLPKCAKQNQGRKALISEAFDIFRLC
jgi:hypothetical protein